MTRQAVMIKVVTYIILLIKSNNDISQFFTKRFCLFISNKHIGAIGLFRAIWAILQVEI